jgi:hypothetical protein
MTEMLLTEVRRTIFAKMTSESQQLLPMTVNCLPSPLAVSSLNSTLRKALAGNAHYQCARKSASTVAIPAIIEPVIAIATRFQEYARVYSLTGDG